MHISAVYEREWPATVIAWYGDPGFAATLLEELGWTALPEEPIPNASVLEKLVSDISDTLPFTEHTDRLILRNINRWNLLIWRNDVSEALKHLADMPLAMPVFEQSFGNRGKIASGIVGLGTERRFVEASGDAVDPHATRMANQFVAVADSDWIVEDEKTVGVTWRMRLVNSIGLPASKALRVYGNFKRTLSEFGAPAGLFELDPKASGKLSLIPITDLE